MHRGSSAARAWNGKPLQAGAECCLLGGGAGVWEQGQIGQGAGFARTCEIVAEWICLVYHANEQLQRDFILSGVY